MIGLHISKIKKYNEEKHSFIYKKCDEFHVTLSFHKIDYRQVYFQSESISVFIDGWVFNSLSYESQCEFIIEMYIKYKENFVFHIEGQFNLFLFDSNNLDTFFINDIFAFRKHFISKSKNISSDLSYLYSLENNITLNKNHLKKNLNQNRLIDIKETFINEVNMIAPSSVIKSDVVENYDSDFFKNKYLINEGKLTPSYFYKQVLLYIKKVHKKTPVLLQLSGGMDSRFLLESFVKNKLEVDTLIYGTLKSDELNIAREVAKANNVICNEVEYLPEDYTNLAGEYCYNTCGLDIFVQSSFNKNKKITEKYKNKNYVFDTGIGLNTFIGGTQILKQYKVTSNNFFNDKFDLSANDIYTSNLRIFSQLVLRQKYHREFLEDRYSMFSYENYFLMKSIPIKALKKYAFYTDLAELSIKNSREVKIQATMLPFYKNQTIKGKKKLERKELNSLKEFIKTKKYFPHNRYYSDFDMWIRTVEQWEELIKRTILKENSLVSKLIGINKVIDIVNNHNKGIENNMRLIIRLISTELFYLETKKHLKNDV